MICVQKMLLSCVLGICCSLVWQARAVGALRVVEEKVVESIQQAAYTKKRLITLISLDWDRKCQLLKNKEEADRYRVLLDALCRRLITLFEMRGDFVKGFDPAKSGLSEGVMGHLDNITLLFATFDRFSASAEKFKHFSSWDNDLFELLEDIQCWMGFSEKNFAAYMQGLLCLSFIQQSVLEPR